MKVRAFISVVALAAALIYTSVATAHRIMSPGPVSAWLCIHSHEAAWNNNHLSWDGQHTDYEGGLQMDSGFQRTYGWDFMWKHRIHGVPQGAHTWTPLEQMIAANRARVGVDWRGSHWPGPRGFTPWPNTARVCGLL